MWSRSRFRSLRLWPSVVLRRTALATTKEEMATNQFYRRERAKSNGPADDAGGNWPRVLAADDNSINRLLLARHLIALGMQPVMAEDGAEALAHWRDDDGCNRRIDGR